MSTSSLITRSWRGAVLGASMASLGGCALLGGGSGGEQRTVIVYPGGDTSPDPVIVPASHLPGPGECRLWYPDREPDDQPEPAACDELQHRVPPGAVLVRG